MKKKLFILFYCFLTIFLTSCFEDIHDNYLPEYESGYFKYVLQKNKDNSKSAYLTGFTEQGLQQRYIVLPSTIENYEIEGFGYLRTQTLVGAYYASTFRSDKLEKLYVLLDKDGIRKFDNREGILPNCFLVTTNSSSPCVNIYNGLITSFKEFQKAGSIMLNNPSRPFKIGNISFLYNYENSPFDNYYWIDSYDNDLVEFIPPTPTREGYVFDGWYKDQLFIEKWDFSVDTTGDEINLTYLLEYKEYTGIFLYAKWVSNV